MEKLISSNDIAALQQIRNIYMMMLSSDIMPEEISASMATLIALCTKENLGISNLTVQQAYLLCNTMIYVPFSNYGLYDRIVGNPKILDLVMQKTDTLTDQLNILEGALDYCDDNGYDDMDDETYKRAISDCSKIVAQTVLDNDIQPTR